ncbi:MAG: tetratricopeptide repeat protein [Flavobacteriales bacterium]|nr:tetratricopeptide repeat protein [Flavobacteriales bacterium]
MKYCFVFWIFLMLTPTTGLNAQSKAIQKVDNLLLKGDTSKALKKLNQFIEKAPRQADLYLKRAKLKIQRGDLEPAMVDLNSFCSLNKVCGEADLWKGVVRFKQGDYNGAISYLSIYTNKREDADAWFYLAQSHMWLQNYPVAINAFQRSIDLRPNEVSAIYNAGLCAYHFAKYGDADSLMQAAERLAPDDLDIRVARGLALLRGGKHAESNDVFQSIKEGESQFPAALYNMGVNYYNLNEFDLACEYWARAVEEGHLQAESSKKHYCGKKTQADR